MATAMVMATATTTTPRKNDPPLGLGLEFAGKFAGRYECTDAKLKNPIFNEITPIFLVGGEFVIAKFLVILQY